MFRKRCQNFWNVIGIARYGIFCINRLKIQSVPVQTFATASFVKPAIRFEAIKRRLSPWRYKPN